MALSAKAQISLNLSDSLNSNDYLFIGSNAKIKMYLEYMYLYN